MIDRINIASPVFNGNERAYVLECLDSTWISSHGRFVDEFERSFAAYCGVSHGISTSNGTTGLHLALVALGIGPGDEVIVPTVTYIASANAVTYCGATPVFVDVLPGTLVIDPAAMAEAITERTRAVIPVHLYGQPAAMTEIAAIAAEHGIFVVEDAAEAHGAAVGDHTVGALGHVAMFSFFGNKIITTGEGGMVVTNDDDLAAKLRLYRGQGMDPTRRYWFPVVGFNYRMTNIQAAIGLAQLEQIDQSLERRAVLTSYYDVVLSERCPALFRPSPDAGTSRVDWMYNVFVPKAEDRASVMRTLDASGVETRPVFYPMHQLPPYASAQAFPVADEWAARGISLPMHEMLTESDIDRIAVALELALAEL